MLSKQESDRNRMFDTMDAQGHPQANLTCLVSEKAADEFFALYEDPEGNTTFYDDFKEGGAFYYYAQ